MTTLRERQLYAALIEERAQSLFVSRDGVNALYWPDAIKQARRQLRRQFGPLTPPKRRKVR